MFRRRENFNYLGAFSKPQLTGISALVNNYIEVICEMLLPIHSL